MWERLLGQGGGWGHLLWSLFLSQALGFQALSRIGVDRLGADWDPLPQAHTLVQADITRDGEAERRLGGCWRPHRLPTPTPRGGRASPGSPKEGGASPGLRGLSS